MLKGSRWYSERHENVIEKHKFQTYIAIGRSSNHLLPVCLDFPFVGGFTVPFTAHCVSAMLVTRNEYFFGVH